MKLGSLGMLAICPHLKRAKALEPFEPLHLGTNRDKSFSINTSQGEQLLAGIGKSPRASGFHLNVAVFQARRPQAKEIVAVERVFQPIPVLGAFENRIHLLVLGTR